jgi:pyruvate/2-oxoglutarate dehydrogenase complex dihydrolipoamide dehydrogenase (E3) component
MTEKEARAAGRNVRVASMPMTWVARALEIDETVGLMRAVVDGDTDAILGFAMLGIDAGEVAGAVQIAMMGGLPYTALRDGAFSHPTTLESLNNLFAQLA